MDYSILVLKALFLLHTALFGIGAVVLDCDAVKGGDVWCDCKTMA